MFPAEVRVVTVMECVPAIQEARVSAKGSSAPPQPKPSRLGEEYSGTGEASQGRKNGTGIGQEGRRFGVYSRSAGNNGREKQHENTPHLGFEGENAGHGFVTEYLCDLE